MKDSQTTGTHITVTLVKDGGKVRTGWPAINEAAYTKAKTTFANWLKEKVNIDCEHCEKNQFCDIGSDKLGTAWWSSMLLEWVSAGNTSEAKLEFNQIWSENRDLYFAQLVAENLNRNDTGGGNSASGDTLDKGRGLLCRVASGKASDRFPGPTCRSYIYLIAKHELNSNDGDEWYAWFLSHTLRITVSKNVESCGQAGSGDLVLEIREEKPKQTNQAYTEVNIPAVLGADEKSVVTLASSPRVTEVIAKMNEVWSGIDPSATVLTSPPGSGKEVMMKFLARGLCPKYPMRTTTLIGQKEGVDRILFGHADNGYYYPGLVWQARHGDRERMIDIKEVKKSNDKTKPVSQGLRKEVLGVIFIDEIHQASKTGRSILLRLLENKVYQPQGWPVDLNADGVVFLFASSMPPAELLKLPPSDFWTRISSFLHMPNPLDVSPDKRMQVISLYFHFFWNMACKNARDDASEMSTNSSKGPVKTVLDRIVEHACAFPEINIDKTTIQDQAGKYLSDVPESILCVRHMRILSFDLFGKAIRYIGTHGTGDKNEDEHLLTEWWKEHGQMSLHRRSWELLAGGK